MGRQNRRYCSNRCKVVGFRSANRDRLSAYMAEWIKANPEKRRANQRSYVARNRAKTLAYYARYNAARSGQRHEYYAANAASALARNAIYRAANREKILARRAANVGRIRAVNAAWKQANPDRLRVYDNNRRARQANTAGSFTGKDFRLICESQRYRCAGCHKRRDLTADHIIPISLGGSSFPWNIQGLCQPCNSGKHNRIAPGAQFGLFDKTEMVAA